MNPFVFAVIYAVVGALLIPVGFAVFKTRYQFLDVALAAVGGAVLTLIPTIGGVASLLGTIAILYWRLGKDLLFPDIVISVAVARLAMLPVLLLFAHR